MGVLVVSENDGWRGALVAELRALALPAQLVASDSARDARRRITSRSFVSCIADEMLRDGGVFELMEVARSSEQPAHFICRETEAIPAWTLRAAENEATFLLKPHLVRDLAAVIGVLIARTMWRRRAVEERVVELIDRLRIRVRLTPRHHDLLPLLRRGLAIKEMAQVLGVEGSTISSHLEVLKNRLTTVAPMRESDNLGIWILEQVLRAATHERWPYQPRIRDSVESTRAALPAKRRPAARAYRAHVPQPESSDTAAAAE